MHCVGELFDTQQHQFVKRELLDDTLLDDYRQPDHIIDSALVYSRTDYDGYAGIASSGAPAVTG